MRKSRLVTGIKSRPKILSKRKIKYILVFLYLLAALVNIVGLYPVLPINILAAFVFYGAFFAAVYFMEKFSREKRPDHRTETRFYCLVFMFFLTAAGMTGGIASPLKWIIYTVLIFLAVKRYYLHAGLMLFIYFLTALKYIKAFAVHDSFSFISIAAIIAILGMTERRGAQASENRDEEKDYGVESGKESKDFKIIAYDLLNKLAGAYRMLLKARSLIFFVRDPEDDNIFEMLIYSSENTQDLDTGYRIDMREGLLGAALKKNNFFMFDVKGIRVNYYRKKPEIKKVATSPVFASKMIGAVVADFESEDAAGAEGLKEKINDLAGEIINIMQLFDINKKVMDREKRVSMLYDIYGKLNMLEGKTELVQAFFNGIRGFDIISGYLAEYIPEQKAFEITEVYNYPGSVKAAKFSARDDEVIKKVFNSGENLILRDTALKNMRLNFQKREIDKFLISPIKRGGRIYGLIKLDKEKEHDFNEFETRTLDMMFSRIAMLLENTELYEKIKKQATLDGLTGLYNHLTFQEMLRKSMGKRDRGEIQFVSLCVMDIDFFKKFNDSFGHQEGDNVLVKLSAALKGFTERFPGTYAARYGGEEFVYVMEDYDIYRASRLADEIRKFSENNLKGGGNKEQRKITLSVGVTTYPDYARTPREMVKHADEALYLAKEQGRNMVKSVIDLKKMQ